MNLKMPKFINKTVIILLTGLSIILVFALVCIVPSNKEIAKLDSDISATKTKIEVQEQLGPAYRQLTEKLKLIDKKAVLITPKPIDRAQLGSLNLKISALAEKSRMTLVAVYPDTASTESGVYYASLRGKFLDFRNFLVELGALPYLSDVQEIKIQTSSGIREFNIKMKLLVA